MTTTPVVTSQHQWIAAAWIPTTPDQAAQAQADGHLTIPPGTQAEALDIACGHCRKPYTPEVADEPCVPLDV